MAEMTTNSTEKLILAAAEEEFLSKGFAGARTVAIAEKAGVTHAMLHYYFRTKEHLFESVLDDKMQLLATSVLDSMSVNMEESSLMDRIEAFIRSHLRFVTENQRLPLFLLNEIVSNPERLEMLKTKIEGKARALVGECENLLSDAVERGEICRIDLPTLIADIVSLNLCAVIAKPLFMPLAKVSESDYFAWRCEEIVEVIKKRISI